VQRVRVLISGALVATGVLGAAMPVMGQGAAVPVEIRAGSCDDPGSTVSFLSDVPRLERAPIGAPDAIPAASSFSSVPVALEALTGEDHIVLVPSGDGDRVLSCGAIGGPLTEGGSLIIGLEAEGRGGLTGIAYFSPNADPSFTDVSVFLAGRSLTATRTSVTSEQPAVAQAAPTAVPTAAPVVQQGLTAEEQAYIQAILPIMETITESSNVTADLFQNPRIGEDDWTFQVATQFVIWEATLDEAKAIVPPPAFASIHDLILQSLTLLTLASDDIAFGIDNFDPVRLEQGANKIVQAGELMNQVTAELEQLAAERGI
jgi:hypothetical protein